MTDLLKDFVQSLHERIRSPILGSIMVSLVLWNWKALYLLFFTDVPAVAKIWYVQTQSDLVYSLFYPLASGLVIAIAIPFITAFGAWAASRPKFWLFQVESLQVSRQAVEKLRIEELQERVLSEQQARREREEIERVERLQRAEKVDPELAEEIKTTRQVTLMNLVEALSEEAKTILKAAAESQNRSRIDLMEFIGGARLTAGTLGIERRDTGERKWQAYIAAVEELRGNDLISSVGTKGKAWEVTSAGFRAADYLYKK